MIPHELLDGDARIDSSPDRMHAGGALCVSKRRCIHEPLPEQAYLVPRSLDDRSVDA